MEKTQRLIALMDMTQTSNKELHAIWKGNENEHKVSA